MKALEAAFFGVFFACWCAAVLHLAGWTSLAGTLTLQPQTLFTLAAAQGWLVGNVYVHRRRTFPAPLRRRLLPIYLLMPPGLFYLLWAMTPRSFQLGAPLTPTLALGVSSILFFVPVTLRNWPRRDG